MTTTAVAPSTAQCEAHRLHVPRPTYLERHHVIPQAWQRAAVRYQWAFVPAPGVAWASLDPVDRLDRLWDPRTVDLCRTGHGNVHYWLVRLVHALHGGGPGMSLDLAQRIATAGRRANPREIAIARLSIERWQAMGLTTDLLAARRLWGEI